jgi:hypothetical protein
MTKSSSTETKPVTSSKFFLFRLELMLIIISLSALILSAYSFELVREHANFLQQFRSNLQQQLTINKNLKETLATLSESHASVQNEVSQLMAKINQNVLSQNESYLMVKQAKEYLELAKIESRWQNNSSTYFMFLQQAQRLLKIPQEASLQPTIDQLELLISQTQTSPNQVLNQIFEQFHSLENQLIQLDSSKNLDLQPAEPGRSLHTKLLSIQRHPTQTPPPHLLEDLGINRIILNLQLAKLAFIQNDSLTYQSALQHALSDLDPTLMNQPETLNALKALILQLKNSTLASPVQNLDPILAQLTQWLHEHRLSTSTPS